MTKSSEIIKAMFNPEAAFDIEMNPVPWQREAAELQETPVTRQFLPLIPYELELRGRLESALHD